MRPVKSAIAILIGLVLIYLQTFESRPALCVSAACWGFNIVWLMLFLLGLYVLWRGVRLLLKP